MIARWTYLELQGKRRRLLLTLGALHDIEAETGICVLNPRPTGVSRLKETALFLWALLQADDPGVTQAEVRKALNLQNLPAAIKAVEDAWRLGMPEKADPNPSDSKKKSLWDWHDLSAMARICWGMPKPEFFSLTPREFFALLTCHDQESERLDRRAALLCMVMANCNRRKGAKPFKVEDFMPTKKKKPAMSWQQMLQVAKTLTAAYGGKVPK